MNEGFRWCKHCGKPHGLAERRCLTTGHALDGALHNKSKPAPAGRTPDASSLPLIGKILDGRYRILRTIGSGGMGIVFEAEDLTLGRFVAVKVVARAGSAEALARLAREATLIAAVRHANICEVYGAGSLPAPAHGPYVVFERLVGETLAAHQCTPRVPSVLSTLDLFVQILSGLEAAHAMRILHRDLKPQNVFLVARAGGSPLVKLVDFGFAQDMSAGLKSRITRPGIACGTVQYMSPEQVRTMPLDPRSDIFATGVMLYESLTGRHPFAAASRVGIQTNILCAEPRPPRSRRRSIPEALGNVVMAALEKDPERRPASASAMQHVLASIRNEMDLECLSDDSSPSSLTGPLVMPPSSRPSSAGR